MSRWIAACFVMIAAVAFTGAQAAKDKKSIGTRLDEKRQWVWVLPADGEVTISDLLTLYGSCRNLLILFDDKKIAGSTSFKAPDDTELSGDDIDLFVANSLEEYRLVLTLVGGNQYKILPSVEAITHSPVVTVDELDATPAWQWVTLVYRPANVDENALRGALQNMTSRQGGVVNPISGGGLLICDRADRVRGLLKAAVTIDDAMASEIKSYAVPEGVKLDDAIKALQTLFSASHKFRMNPPTFARATDESTVIVRGTSELHAEVAEALKIMK